MNQCTDNTWINQCTDNTLTNQCTDNTLTNQCTDNTLTNHNVQMVMVMVFNPTYNNISVIFCQSFLSVEETRVPGENH
jgi:hypothetical protein